MTHRRTVALLLSSLVSLICVNACTTGTVVAQKPRMTDQPQTTPEGRTYFMFVQSADSGSVAPIEGKSGAFRLTLQGVAPTTVYFSDRPARVSGHAPMDKFLKALGFSAKNPPNAAIDVVGTDGSSHLAVVTLESPRYDAGAATLSYDVRLLPGEKLPTGLSHLKTRLGDLPPTFNNVALFIDDCPDAPRYCYAKRLAFSTSSPPDGCIADIGKYCGAAQSGTCWNWFPMGCSWCHAPEPDCARYFSGCCVGSTGGCDGCTATDVQQ